MMPAADPLIVKSVIDSWAQSAALELHKPPASPAPAAPNPAPQPAPKIPPATVKTAPPDDVQARILKNMGKAKPPAPTKADDQFIIFDCDAVAMREEPPWRIKRLFPREGIGAIAGEFSAGKSFFKDDLAFTVSDGGTFFGLPVDPCEVICFNLEGQAGTSRRVKAIRKHRGMDAGKRLRFVEGNFNLKYADDVDALIAKIKAAGYNNGVFFIDTMNAASAGVDENASADMGRIIEAVKRIQAEIGGLVILIHHLGKDVSRGLRGHSSLSAALDFIIEIRRDGERRSWKLAKSKDDADGEEHPFRLKVVEIGEDDDGDPITSCVVMPDDDAKTATRSKQPKGGNQRIVWDALGELLRESGISGKAGAPNGRPCVELEAAVAAIAPRLAVEDRRKVERTRQALTGLIASRLIECRYGWLWLP